MEADWWKEGAAVHAPCAQVGVESVGEAAKSLSMFPSHSLPIPAAFDTLNQDDAKLY